MGSPLISRRAVTVGVTPGMPVGLMENFALPLESLPNSSQVSASYTVVLPVALSP